MEEKVKKIMSKIFVLEQSLIEDNASRENIEMWDSLQHLLFISALQDDFNLSFTPEEIQKMTSLDIILNLLRKKLE